MKNPNVILIAVMSMAVAACSSTRKAAKDDWQTDTGEPYCKMPVPKDYAQTRNLIIFYDANTGKKQLIEAAEKFKSAVIYEYNNFNAIAVTVPDGKSQEEAVKYYNAVEGVVSVSIDQVNR